MSKNAWWKLLLVVGIPVVLWFSGTPSGLDVKAWHLFAIYAGGMLGIILRPFPEPVVMLLAVAAAGLLLKEPKVALAGYANSTVWLVFVAFLLSQAFIDTRLGRRISYVLLKYFGRSALSVGYVEAVTDLILSPGMPSNTARSGGVVYPIFQNVALSLGSEPGPTGRKVGSYLTILMEEVSHATATLFLTAQAPNLLLASFALQILHVDLSWGTWALANAVPGLLIFICIPWLVYKIYPPELKAIPDSRSIAEKGLAEMGPMQLREILLAVLFVLAIAAWATGKMTGLDATMVAIGLVSLCLACGVVSWESVASSKGAWGTLIWYGGIVGLASGLAEAKFFEWLAAVIGKYLGGLNLNQTIILAILLVTAFAFRYVVASTAGYVAAFVPVLFTVALSTHTNPMTAALLIALTSGLGGVATQYSGALGPVLYGTGYVDQATWWKIGLVVMVFAGLVQMIIGIPYWKMVGLI